MPHRHHQVVLMYIVGGVGAQHDIKLNDEDASRVRGVRVSFCFCLMLAGAPFIIRVCGRNITTNSRLQLYYNAPS